MKNVIMNFQRFVFPDSFWEESEGSIFKKIIGIIKNMVNKIDNMKYCLEVIVLNY